MTRGTLYLIPVPLGAMAPDAVLPLAVLETPAPATPFRRRNANRPAPPQSRGDQHPLQELVIAELNEHTRSAEVAELLQPPSTATMSDWSRKPAARPLQIPGQALVAFGPGGKASGCGWWALVSPAGPHGLRPRGRFAFTVTSPRKKPNCSLALRELEQSRRRRQTQIFIETLTAIGMFDAILKACQPETRVTLAIDLTLPGRRYSPANL